ncbi:MAG: hypothetical protein RLY44_558, partial [Actinomycetota bacterium]
YNPKAFIPHAALLHQACAHCAIFPTAASRRSLGRVSVPVWPVALSGRLPVVALVSRYLTNKLIGRETIHHRNSFPAQRCRCDGVFGISTGFPVLSQNDGQVSHVFLTRSPLIHSRRNFIVRLACVKHAASVRPEPGSNSPLNFDSTRR